MYWLTDHLLARLGRALDIVDAARRGRPVGEGRARVALGRQRGAGAAGQAGFQAKVERGEFSSTTYY